MRDLERVRDDIINCCSSVVRYNETLLKKNQILNQSYLLAYSFSYILIQGIFGDISGITGVENEFFRVFKA